MALEIERRFLIKNNLWKEFIISKSVIEQGYLTHDLKDWIVRIRFNGKGFKIALKKHIKNFTNYEYEYDIPNSDGEEIMSSLANIVKKERYLLELDKRQWIIDCFKGDNYPLKIAETELSKEKEKIHFPSFLSQEITSLKLFSNFSLATYPFKKWTNEDLKNFKNI